MLFSFANAQGSSIYWSDRQPRGGGGVLLLKNPDMPKLPNKNI